MKSLLTAAALVASTFAAPAQHHGHHKFEVQQVHAGQVLRRLGPVAMMKTYQKFASTGAQAPAVVIKAAVAAAQNGSVAANPEFYDASYLCPVTMGDQILNLDFDTGSADL